MSAIGVGCLLLKDLKISGCEQITDIGLGFVARNCKLLEPCSMTECCGISRTGVANLIGSCRKIFIYFFPCRIHSDCCGYGLRV